MAQDPVTVGVVVPAPSDAGDSIIEVPPRELLGRIKKRVKELKEDERDQHRCDCAHLVFRDGVLEGLIAVAREIEPGYTGDEP